MTTQFQDTENLFRRYRGKFVEVRTISGDAHEGTVGDVTNEFATLEVAGESEQAASVAVMFRAIESVMLRQSD